MGWFILLMPSMAGAGPKLRPGAKNSTWDFHIGGKASSASSHCFPGLKTRVRTKGARILPAGLQVMLREESLHTGAT